MFTAASNGSNNEPVCLESDHVELPSSENAPLGPCPNPFFSEKIDLPVNPALGGNTALRAMHKEKEHITHALRLSSNNPGAFTQKDYITLALRLSSKN